MSIWQPQPKQFLFQSRKEYEALYGGAAGGGKSDALLTEALRQVHIPHYRALILRKTAPQLTELIDRSRTLYKAAFPDATYNGTERCWTFKSGAKIYFGTMQYTKDRVNYQGKRYDYIAFDELTHFTYDEYSYMFSRNRPSGSGTRVYMRAATNPGGVGHAWVKERFISPAPPLTTIVEQNEIFTPYGKEKVRRDRVFVPSTVFDNKKLLTASPEYAANLSLLPHAEREALLYGSWDSFSGQVFSEWVNNPEKYEERRFTHVIKPFKIPKNWRIWRGFDFGYTKPFSVGWFAADEDGRLYHIREYYGCTGTPDTGLKLTPSQIAAEIKRIENEDENLKGRNIIGVADPSIFDESRGESIAHMMSRSPYFITFSPGDNTRMPGKMQFHYRLSFDENGIPMFYVFDTCKNFIRTFPSLVYDSSNVEDINTKSEDHIYDMTRYVFMERPISPQIKPKEKILLDDPLNLRKKGR